MPAIPASHPVQPLQYKGSAAHIAAEQAGTLATCGACHLSWDDGKATAYTPAPSARCPFEAFHDVERNGTSYAWDAAPGVIDALERARANGTRVRLFYGDTETGKAWAEESDVVGTLSRSMGPVRVPILLASSRSTGGGAVSTGSIVAIAIGPGRFAYRHPTFNPGAFVVQPSDLPDYAERVDVDGTPHARFKKPGQAARWVQFMTGQRMAP